MADSGMIYEAPALNGENLPKQKIVKRRIPKSKSFMSNIFTKNSESYALVCYIHIYFVIMKIVIIHRMKKMMKMIQKQKIFDKLK